VPGSSSFRASKFPQVDADPRTTVLKRFDGEPKGSMVKLGVYDTYVATPDAPREGKASRAIVFFYDIFGLGIKNPKVSLIKDEGWREGNRAAEKADTLASSSFLSSLFRSCQTSSLADLE